jgi:endoglycosylceramidase
LVRMFRHGWLCLITGALLVALDGSAFCQESEKKTESLSQLRTEGTWIKNDRGETVILRGLNLCALQDYVDSEKWLKESAERGLDQIVSWGFNVVRMPISWAVLEPEPDKFNDAKLKVLDGFLKLCAKKGVYVIIDMHQWNWSARFAGDGAPQWSCEKFEAAPWDKDMRPMLYAATEFWRDRKLWDHFAAVWRLVAERYKDDPAVAGYDLFNEPNPGLLGAAPGKFEEKILRPFYRKLIETIRAVDRKHIIFYEPVVIRGNLFKGANIRCKLGKLEGDNLVYIPHLYTGGTGIPTTGYDGDAEMLEADVKMVVAEAKEAGVPLLIGEFGVGSRAPKALEFAAAECGIYEKNLIGSIWWSYGCDDTFGVLDPQGNEKKELLDVLCRPFVRTVTGEIEKAFFDPKEARYACTLKTSGKESRGISATIFVPRRKHFEAGFRLSVDGKFEIAVRFGPTESVEPVSVEFQGDYACRWDAVTSCMNVVVKNGERAEIRVTRLER